METWSIIEETFFLSGGGGEYTAYTKMLWRKLITWEKKKMFPYSHHAQTKFKREKIHKCKKAKIHKTFRRKYRGYLYDNELGKNQTRYKKHKS